MKAIDVDGMVFQFPDDLEATKYDEWDYYRRCFSRTGNGIKAVDLLVIEPGPDTVLWLIEVKDYSKHERTKLSELHIEVIDKVL